MDNIGNVLSKKQLPAPDAQNPDDAKYTLVMHGLCKKYDIKSPLERHVFSIIENMSRRGTPCLYGIEKFGAFSGGSAEEIAAALSRLEQRGIIVRGKMKNTQGWKLSAEVRRDANLIKQKIDRMGRDKHSHN